MRNKQSLSLLRANYLNYKVNQSQNHNLDKLNQMAKQESKDYCDAMLSLPNKQFNLTNPNDTARKS